MSRIGPDPESLATSHAFGRVLSTDERRQLVLDAGARVFEARGFHGASMQQIAVELGVTKAALYHYVESKEQMLYEIHDVFVTAMTAEASEFISAHDDPEEQLEFLVHSIFRNVSVYRPYVRAFFEDITSLSPEWYEKIRQKRDGYEGMIEQCLADGIEEGTWSMPVPPNLGAMFFFGACCWAYQWMNPAGPQKPEDLADAWFTMLSKSFAADAPPPKRKSRARAVSKAK